MIDRPSENKRQDIEQFLLSLSLPFISIPPEEIDPLIESSLGTIADFVKTDRCYIYLFDENHKSITLTHSFSQPGIKSKIARHDRIDSEDFSWPIKPLLKRTLINISSPQELPSKAGTFKAIMGVETTQSFMWCPLVFQKNCLGFIGLDAVREKRSFSGNTEYLLKKIAYIFASAIYRKDRLKNESQLEKKFRTLFSEIDDVVYISTPEGRFIDINPAGARLFGYSSVSELLNVDISTHIYSKPSDRDSFREIMRKEGQVKDYELSLKDKNDKKFIAMITASAVKDENGKIIAFQGILRDVTYRRQLEQQLFQAKKMESIGMLAGGVAHDFNNILTIINGFAELVLMDMSPANKHYEDVENIMKGVRRAEDLIRQLLAFSRKQMIEPRVIDINKVITDLLSMLKRIISEDIHLKLQLNEDIGFIKADPGQIQQILVNLVVNANQAIKKNRNKLKSKTITITTQQKDLTRDFTAHHPGSREGRFILITVRDTGIGIAEETKPFIFEPFFSTDKDGRGTGLGLSTVYGIAKQNDANIYVESKPGKGSEFQLYWPISREKKSPEARAESDVVFQRRTENILFVEDDANLRKLMCNTLLKFGYQVIEAGDGRQALNLVKKKSLAFKIDLVISDIIMPEMGGEELAENLRQLNPDIKILLTSGFTDSRISMKDSYRKNGYDFLVKPYSIKKLEKTIRSILSEPA